MEIKKQGRFAALKELVPVAHQSSFDFSQYGMTDTQVRRVVERESIIFKNFKQMSESMFEVCRALYEASLDLKAEGSFMEWYQHLGLSKDKVSELLKRYDLYLQFNDKRDWVTSLSTQAVKVLTNKNVNEDMLLEIYDKELKKVDEIKSYLALDNKTEVIPVEVAQEEGQVDSLTNSTTEDIEIEFFTKLNSVGKARDFIKSTSSIDVLKNKMKMIASLERQAAELRKLVEERMDNLSQENNMRIFDEE